MLISVPRRHAGNRSIIFFFSFFTVNCKLCSLGRSLIANRHMIITDEPHNIPSFTWATRREMTICENLKIGERVGETGEEQL